MGLFNWKNFNESYMDKRTIMNIFLCGYTSPNWEESIRIFKSIKFPTSIQISGSDHRGLGYQVLLDLNIVDSKNFVESIYNLFPEEPLIVISEVNVILNKDTHIGEHQDHDLVKPGRYFSNLVKNGKSGIFVL
jgi:hypothetical protein